MKILGLLILIIGSSCASKSDKVAPDRIITLKDTTFIGNNAYCRIHKNRMTLSAEKQGPGVTELPQEFLQLQGKEFPNDGYFYPACTNSNNEPVWVCEECQRRSTKAKTKWPAAF